MGVESFDHNDMGNNNEQTKCSKQERPLTNKQLGTQKVSNKEYSEGLHSFHHIDIPNNSQQQTKAQIQEQLINR